MGNRVYLELRGSELTIMPEEDEEDVVALECNNGLPLFWLALLREKNIGGYWTDEIRTMFADPGEFTPGPLQLSWREARANLASARERAQVRLPGLRRLFGAWAEALEKLAAQGPTQEVRLYLAEYASCYEDADRFLEALCRSVRIWHGPERPVLPRITDPEAELTGVCWRTGASFPATLPIWRPGRPVPGSRDRNHLEEVPGRASSDLADWVAVLVVAVAILGATMLGASLLGSAGAWMGGALGLAASVVALWKWVRWDASHRP